MCIQVAQYHQAVDPNAITAYLTQNLRNVCISSSYALMLAISTMKVTMEPPTEPEAEPNLISNSNANDNSPVLPRASLPKMMIDFESKEHCMNPKKEKPKEYYTYELKHELPMKCAGTIRVAFSEADVK